MGPLPGAGKSRGVNNSERGRNRAGQTVMSAYVKRRTFARSDGAISIW